MSTNELNPLSAIEDRPHPSMSRIIGPGQTYESVTDKISSIVLTRPAGWKWWTGLAVSFFFVNVLLASIGYLFLKGVGIWGINIPVGWGFAIVNFVWWIGIGHAGTFISAILLLVRQQWRTSINRFAEAMTLFAVACAGLFPLLHLGRPQFFYFLAPYPNTMRMWPQFRSPLVWDFFAVSTYATVSFTFWFIGLIPDFATLRDKATKFVPRVLYGALAMGWRGSARHWHRYETAYLLLAGLATPLVLSVHSIVSLDFSGGIVPGWHSTIFPPYFVAGAIYSGFAMVLTLAIPLRKFYGLENYITDKHLENCAKLMLTTGLIVGYGYMTEAFMAWYSGSAIEASTMMARLGGVNSVVFYSLMFCNILNPQLLWFKKVRTSVPALFAISIVVNIGMWLERYLIVVGSLRHDYIPSMWRDYSATIWDWATYLGTLGLFFFLFLLFIRVLPVIAISEMQKLVEKTHEEEHP